MKRLAMLVLAATLAAPALAFASNSTEIAVDPPTATLATAITLKVNFESDFPQDASVSIGFPDAMRVPEKISNGLVLANALPVSNATIEGETLTFQIPEPQEQRRELIVRIPISAGFKNPLKAGNYQISVTVGDETSNGFFNVEKIVQDAPKVSVKPDRVGRRIGVTIQIPHPEGLVVQKDDMLDIVFPQEFIFPETIDADALFACNDKPPTVLTDNNSIKLSFARDIPQNEPLTIVIEPQFGIRSPLWPGNFSLVVAIPGKLEDTMSEVFQILPLSPTLTVIIDPPMPQSGWFSSIPTIQLVSSSKREIYYSWDYSPKEQYKEPIKPEAGIHVLTYAGRVENGGWEAELSETFRVDLDDPEFESLKTSANTEELTLTYKVVDTSQCISGVGDSEAKQTGFNTFEIELKLGAGSNNFVFWAEDVVGRRIESPHQIILDKTPPALTISTPAQASVVCGKEVTVTGKTESGAKVKINGNDVIPNSKGDFIGIIRPTEEGPIDINVSATDPAGNTNSVVIPIIYIRSTKIVMKLGSKQVQIAGKNKEIETAPYEKFGTAFFPITSIAGWLGYKVSTLDKKSYTLEDKEKNKVTFTLDSNVVQVEGKQGLYKRTLEMSPEISDGAVCVPVEFVDRGLGLETLSDSNTITILFCPKS